MFNRFALCFALGFQSLFALVYASNDLEKWNSPQGQLVRQKVKEKLNTTTYREIDSFQVKDAQKSSNNQKIQKMIEASATLKGSRVGVDIDALKEKNIKTTAAKWAKELGKGGLRFTVGAVLIEEAMQQMLDGIGWIIDEGGKVSKLNTKADFSIKPTDKYVYVLTDTFNNVVFIARYDTSKSSYLDSICAKLGLSIVSNEETCVLGGIGGQWRGDITRKDNPYKTDPIPKTEPLSEKQIEQKLNEYLKDPKTPQNIKDIFHEQAEKPKGKAKIMWSDDPSSAVEIFSDDKKLVNDILDSDNPVADKLTPVIPDLVIPKDVEGDITPNPNPEPETITDPETGNQIPNPNYDPNHDSGSSFKFELPAFCDYASIVCEWIDWTKEKPDEEEQENEKDIDDQGIFDREFDIDFFMPSSCPPDYTFRFDSHKDFTHTFTVSFNWLCMFFSGISYALIFASHCVGAWIMYEIALRRSKQG